MIAASLAVTSTILLLQNQNDVVSAFQFQKIRSHRPLVELNESRRSYLSKTIGAFTLISIPLDVAFAEQHQQEEPDSVITTPTITEGEITASPPPPNRAKEIVVVPEKKKSSLDPRFFIAGGASAAVSHGLTTPIDVVKTRMQSEKALANISPIEAAYKIIENEGVEALSAGVAPTVVGYGLEGALKFGVYESLKPIFVSLFVGGSSGEAYLASAVCAGALASIILCPMEEVRIRLVTDPSSSNGFVDGLQKIIKDEGVLSIFIRGIQPMLTKQVPYTMGKQVSFDVFAGMLYSLLMGLSFVPQKEIALEVEVLAAFLASIVACLSSHPGDVLLTATYKDTDDASDTNDKGFGSTIRKVYSDGGFSAFFRGLDARFIHVGCIITLQLILYDQIKIGLGLSASGQ